MMDSSKIDWHKMAGLLPCLVQDARTYDVLMLGYMNEEALAATMATKKVTFFSRSKHRLWQKGETSGHGLDVQEIGYDCDQDALLIKAIPHGPTCHKGVQSCFDGDAGNPFGFLAILDELVASRFLNRPKDSYTTKLFDAGMNRMAQKVGEEGVEVALAAKDDDLAAFKGECADLVFHLMVLARAKGLSFADILATLKDRHQS